MVSRQDARTPHIHTHTHTYTRKTINSARNASCPTAAHTSAAAIGFADGPFGLEPWDAINVLALRLVARASWPAVLALGLAQPVARLALGLRPPPLLLSAENALHSGAAAAATGTRAGQEVSDQGLLRRLQNTHKQRACAGWESTCTG